jgi:hypothetical protein
MGGDSYRQNVLSSSRGMLEVSLLDDFIDDVHSFFLAVGVNDEIDISILASGLRQQNLMAEVRGIIWEFRQEPPSEQDLTFRATESGTPSISVNDIGWYFRPPSPAEIRDMATSKRLIKYDLLAEMVPFVRENFDSIVNLVSSSRFPEAVTLARDVKKRVFDAI